MSTSLDGDWVLHHFSLNLLFFRMALILFQISLNSGSKVPQQVNGRKSFEFSPTSVTLPSFEASRSGTKEHNDKFRFIQNHSVLFYLPCMLLMTLLNSGFLRFSDGDPCTEAPLFEVINRFNLQPALDILNQLFQSSVLTVSPHSSDCDATK